MRRLELGPVFGGQISYAEAIDGLDYAALRDLVNGYFDEIGAIIAGMTDADVLTVPHDPALQDQSEGEGAWTLGHVIVHLTASLEESAALSATLARGIAIPEGTRSRHEVPWQALQTARDVTERLAESHRMALAFLDAWPDEPHLDLTTTPIAPLGPMDAVGRYALGLFHADAHLDQLREIMRQGAAKRAGAPA